MYKCIRNSEGQPEQILSHENHCMCLQTDGRQRQTQNIMRQQNCCGRVKINRIVRSFSRFERTCHRYVPCRYGCHSCHKVKGYWLFAFDFIVRVDNGSTREQPRSGEPTKYRISFL